MIKVTYHVGIWKKHWNSIARIYEERLVDTYRVWKILYTGRTGNTIIDSYYWDASKVEAKIRKILRGKEYRKLNDCKNAHGE